MPAAYWLSAAMSRFKRMSDTTQGLTHGTAPAFSVEARRASIAGAVYLARRASASRRFGSSNSSRLESSPRPPSASIIERHSIYYFCRYLAHAGPLVPGPHAQAEARIVDAQVAVGPLPHRVGPRRGNLLCHHPN